jgi:hypothetical protein
MSSYCVANKMLTSPAFRWKDNITCRTWSRVADGKIPTKLVFDTESEDGPPVAWGSQLIGIFAENTRECFKQLMVVDRSKFAELIEPFAPASQIELHHWIREYLRAFCAQAMVTIDIALPLTWKKASIDWSFTVPGCWNQLPVVEDFRRLAEEALSSILQEAKDLRVHTNITEASASAMSLVVGGLVAHEKACPIGDTIISCDIGGSTTDIGLSKICSPGVLEPLGHLRLNPSGFITIEKDIFLHVRETLTNAGADGPTGLALRLVRHPATIDNIVDFTDKLGQDWIKIHFYPDCTVGNWSPSPQAGSKKSYIKDLSLYIHKQVLLHISLP